jgi:hypothetical protein
MKKHPYWGVCSWRLAVTVGVAALTATGPGFPGAALAADRTVLCEEFTNSW